jgi:hypothetical protein
MSYHAPALPNAKAVDAGFKGRKVTFIRSLFR